MTLTWSACLSDVTSLQKVPKVSIKKGTLVEIAANEEEFKLDEPAIKDLHSYGDGDFPQDVVCWTEEGDAGAEGLRCLRRSWTESGRARLSKAGDRH